MLSLVVSIIFGLGIAYFAFQNSLGVPVNLVSYHLANVPLYFVVLTSMLSGILMAWVISAVNGMSHFMRIRSKDGVIQKDQKEIQHLKTKVHEMELENEKLKTQTHEVAAEHKHETIVDKTVHEDKAKVPFFNRILNPRVE